MPSDEVLFPAWWVRRKLSVIRNRCVYDLSGVKLEIEKGSCVYSWSQCMERARNKLKYRLQNPTTNSGEIADEWVTLIVGLKSKLNGVYGLPYEWRTTEYRILERMNKNDFSRYPEIGCLWNFVAVSCANRTNDLMKVKRIRKIRESNESYNNVFGNFSRRMRKLGSHDGINTRVEWQKVLLANKDKIRSRIRFEEWENHIGAMKKKIMKMMSNRS